MQIVDLSHELYTGMPNIAGLHVASWPTETFAGLRSITGGSMAMESRMMLLPEHCGTHLDAPRHCDEAGQTLAEVPLERLCLPGHLLDLRHKRAGEAITVEDFQAAAARTGRPIGPGRALVCWTGTDVHWGTEGWTTRPSGGGPPTWCGCRPACACCSSCATWGRWRGASSCCCACR